MCVTDFRALIILWVFSGFSFWIQQQYRRVNEVSDPRLSSSAKTFLKYFTLAVSLIFGPLTPLVDIGCGMLLKGADLDG